MPLTRTFAGRWAGAARSPWLRLGLLATLLAAALAWAALHGTGVLAGSRAWVAGLGVLGPVAFTAVYALATVLLLPVEVLSIAAGAVFGPVLGVGVVWAGAMLGAAGAFALGRLLSRPAVQALTGGRLERLDAYLRRRGLLAMLIVRLLPVFPFALANYAAAASSVRWRHFLVGTGLGILPGTTAYVALGGSMSRLAPAPFLLVAGALLALMTGGAVLARRLRAQPDRAGVPGLDDPPATPPVTTQP